MKILNVIASMDPASGGTSEAVRNSIPELDKLGAYSEVVSLDSPASAFLQKDNFIINALGPGKGPWCFSKQLEPWLIENLHRFDSVIIHGLWLYPSYSAAKAIKHLKAKKGKAPALYIMPHGMLDPYFQKAAGRKLKAIRNWLYWKLIEGKVVNSANALFFTCQTELELARTSFIPYKPNLEVNVGFGIKQPPVSNSKNQSPAFYAGSHEPYILFLGRIHEKKGVDLLIDAYGSILAESEKKPDAFLKNIPNVVIAGPGLQTPYGQAILNKVQSNSRLKNRVSFPGMLTGDAKWNAYYRCECFILPSHQENFGIAVAEALSCGKPVLISNQVNIWREIFDANAGFVSDDTLEGTKELLLNWIKSSAENKNMMVKQAISCFKEKFHIEQTAKSLLKAINI